MKKFKKLICVLTMATLGLFCFATPVQSNPQVYANMNSDGTLDLGKTREKTTQSAINKYSTLGIHGLYVNGDENATKALYTTRFTNMSGADPIYTVNTEGSVSFSNNAVSMSAGSSTSTSNRSQYISHAFEISDNLFQASKNGYLKLTVGANVSQVNDKDTFYMQLAGGTLDGYTNINKGVYNMTGGVNGTSATYQEVSLTNPQYSQFMVIGATNRGSGSWRNTGVTFSAPTLNITSTDTTKPTITKSISTTDWAKSKTLTFTVSDSQSGLWSVTASKNITLPNPTVSNGAKTYSIPVTANGSYTITVTDAVGNTSTLTHTESKIDTTAPNSVNVEMPSFSTYSEISVIPTFTESGANTETIYYTTDGTTPNANSQTMQNGVENKVTLPDGENTLKFITIDQVGNASQVVEKSVTINTTRYKINVTNTHCDYTITKPTTFETDQGDCAFYGETIRIDFTANENCIKSVLKVNGEEQTFENDYVEVLIQKDITIEVCYAYQIQVVDFVETYEYDPTIENLEVLYTINTTDAVNVKLTDLQGNALSIKNVGTYDIMWECNDYGYIGNGTFQIQVTAIEVYITAIAGQTKIYGQQDPQNYEYKVTGLPQAETLVATLVREEGENVGTYKINLGEHNLSNNYIVHFEECDFSITPRKLVVLANSFTKEYSDQDPEFTYQFYQTQLVDGDTLEGELVREQGEEIGEYVISKGTLNNPNYNILFMNGKLTINKKDINVTISNVETTYGQVKPLQYTTDLEINEGEFSGELVKEQGETVGEYQISIGTLACKNYNIASVTNGVYKINPRQLLVTAKEYTKTYGDKDVLEYQMQGLLAGDSLSGELVREQGENVGEYPIGVGTLANSNYTIEFTGAYLKIIPAELVVTISNKTQVYGELEQDLEYTISGLKFDDQIEIELTREQGTDAGDYAISVNPINNNNYVLSCNNATYTITKTTIVPSLEQQQFTYSGTTQYVTNTNFPFELKYVYKQNGIECEGMLNAGEYQVQAIFEGNQNYEPAQSETVTITVDKQKVYLTLSENKFVYDGQIKFPEFSYNTNCGLKTDNIVFNFKDDVLPTEAGEYTFTIVSENQNYDCTTNGVLVISKQLTIVDEAENVITSAEATFDDFAQNIVLVETQGQGKKFNDKVILSTVTFDNVDKTDDNIYTVKVKAKKDVESVYIYQVSADNTVREIAVKQVDGFYEFKVDNINDSFVIARDTKPLPVWVWEMAGLVVLGSAYIAFSVFKKRKRALQLQEQPAQEGELQPAMQTNEYSSVNIEKDN